MRELLQKSKLLILVVIAVLVVIVVLQNTESVQTKLLFVTLEMPRAALLFCTLVIGFLLGAGVTSRVLSRKSSK